MNIKNDLFLKRIKEYFNDKYELYLNNLDLIPKSFFLNTKKANKEKILSLIDFEIKENKYNPNVYNYIDTKVTKHIINDLGLIYPQDVASTISSLYINKDAKIVLDLCSAPGGKSINILNKLDDDALLIANDISYNRHLELAKNLERLGLDNTIITNKNPEVLLSSLENICDLVILDAPCSGEGMIDKYPEILDTYSLNNIDSCANIQKDLLEIAYRCLKGGGELLYSTCTYAFEEDEKQIKSFLERHSDISLINLDIEGNNSTLKGTIKLSPINKTEGQFIALMKKDINDNNSNIKYLKEANNKIVEEFIRNNLDLDEYYLYNIDNKYYLSKVKLIDLKNNVLRYANYLGDLNNKIFMPNHNLYRSNSLRKNFKYIYELNDLELKKYLNGEEIIIDREDNYYLITYKDISLGFGKLSKGRLKNKYPKGLRRMI